MARKTGPLSEASDRLSYHAFRAFRASVARLPSSLAYTFGDALAAAWWLVDGRRRRLALHNIGTAFPEMPASARAMLAFRNFRHLARVLVETFRLANIGPSDWLKHIRLEGTRNFEEAAALGRGVIGIAAHQGNWELLSSHVFMFGRVHIVARKIRNSSMDRDIRERRERGGSIQIYPDREAPRKILKVLRDGGVVCFLIDQSARGDEGVDVPFFGRMAPTHPGPALFAIRTGAPVVPVWVDRNRSGLLRMHYGKRLNLINTGDLRCDVEANTALFTSRIEEIIKKKPEQWFWVHDRWRVTKRRRKKS